MKTKITYDNVDEILNKKKGIILNPRYRNKTLSDFTNQLFKLLVNAASLSDQDEPARIIINEAISLHNEYRELHFDNWVEIDKKITGIQTIKPGEESKANSEPKADSFESFWNEVFKDRKY